MYAEASPVCYSRQNIKLIYVYIEDKRTRFTYSLHKCI